jgi:hypothetical protein
LKLKELKNKKTNTFTFFRNLDERVSAKVKMCKHCVKDPFVERFRCTMERGSYMLNFAGCFECKSRNDFLLEKNRNQTITEAGDDSEGEEAAEYEESIEYDHCCKSCGHLVAKHFYEFTIKEKTNQEFTMSCALCGKGGDVMSTHVIQPNREQIRVNEIVFVEEEQKVNFPTGLLATATLTAAFASSSLSAPMINQKHNEVVEDNDEWS